MPDQLQSLILDESKWLTVALGAALLGLALMLYRHRQSSLRQEERILGAMTLLFAVTISVMALGHLLAVSLKLFNGTLVGSRPVFYFIGLVLSVPSWWLLVHTIRRFGNLHTRKTLVLNASLAAALLALGLPNLPLAVPGLLNVAYQVSRRRSVKWAIVGATVVVILALFAGSLIFWASGRSFEEFSGMR